MSVRRMRAELRRLPVPGGAGAEERAWEVVRAAYAGRERLPARPRRRLSLALAASAALAAAALSPPGLAVLGSVRDAVSPGARRAPATLVALPAPGRLLVDAADGVWVVSRDGSRRRLGPYRDATWSPHGLFVAAARGHELVALEPDGAVRWTLPRPAPVRLPSWNRPDGYRIAYLAGPALRVVNGDGTGDRLLARAAARVRPAWRPGPEHELAWVRADGAVALAAADRGRTLWTRRLPRRTSGLAWSDDGERLLAVGPGGVAVYDRGGRRLAWAAARAGTTDTAAAFRPGTHEVVVVRRRGSQTGAFLLATGRPLFDAPGSLDGLAWSPDGRWLLLGWRTANQWLFVRVEPARRTVLAFGAVSAAFAPGGEEGASFPALAGWCCSG